MDLNSIKCLCQSRNLIFPSLRDYSLAYPFTSVLYIAYASIASTVAYIALYTRHGTVVACIHNYLTHWVVQLVAEQLLLGHLAVWRIVCN